MVVLLTYLFFSTLSLLGMERMLIKCKKILRIENVGWLPLLRGKWSRTAVRGDGFEPFQSFSVVSKSSL